MFRRLLRPALTVATTLAVMAGALFVIGIWRRSEDARWCERAVMAGTVLGDPQQGGAGFVEEQRSACAEQRQHQRVMFGAMWRKGGTAMAQCGFDLARLQMLSDRRARQAILQPYGLDADFDGVGLAQQDQFIKACLANGPNKAG